MTQSTQPSLSNDRLLDLLDASPGAFFVLDDERCFTFISREAARAWGRTRDDLLGEVCWDVFPELEGTAWRRVLDDAAANGGPITADVDCPIVGRKIRLTAETRSAGLVAHFVDLLDDTDDVTGAADRRAVERVLHQEIKRMDRYNSRFSVVLLDVDPCEAVNDTHGHRVGDQVLTEIVRCLRLDLRSVDRIARWGGEEFLLLLPEIERDDAIQAAERFRAHVAARTFEHATSLTISLGVVMSRPGEDAEALVRRADAALFEAKRSGRNRVVVG